MKEEKLLELAGKLGMNIPATKNHLKVDKKSAEKQIETAAIFMGLIEKKKPKEEE